MMLNRHVLIQFGARLEQMEKTLKAMKEREAELLARLAAIEAKRGPGRPPKSDTE